MCFQLLEAAFTRFSPRQSWNLHPESPNRRRCPAIANCVSVCLFCKNLVSSQFCDGQGNMHELAEAPGLPRPRQHAGQAGVRHLLQLWLWPKLRGSAVDERPGGSLQWREREGRVGEDGGRWTGLCVYARDGARAVRRALSLALCLEARAAARRAHESCTGMPIRIHASAHSVYKYNHFTPTN